MPLTTDHKNLPLVKCFGCKTQNPDEGKGKSCAHCGMSPLPSRMYPTTSPFNPDYQNPRPVRNSK